jgi:hypothetical protein
VNLVSRWRVVDALDLDVASDLKVHLVQL